MSALKHFALGALAAAGLILAGTCCAGLFIFACEAATGLDFPKAGCSALRALLIISAGEVVAGGVAGVIVWERA